MQKAVLNFCQKHSGTIQKQSSLKDNDIEEIQVMITWMVRMYGVMQI